jgi:hypothetical protein
MKTLEQHHLTQKKTYSDIAEIENYKHILIICEKYFYTPLGFSQEDLKITLKHDKVYCHIKKEDKKVIENLLNFMISQKIDYFNVDHKTNDNFLDNNKGGINATIYK